MLNQRIKPRFVWSSVLFLAVLVIALLGKDGGQPSPIHGESDYAIILNSTNAPTTSETYVSANQTVRYTSFEYWDVSFSAGNHGKLGSYGSIWNAYSSPITSITGVTATFTSESPFVVSTTYDHDTFFDFELTSGVR